MITYTDTPAPPRALAADAYSVADMIARPDLRTPAGAVPQMARDMRDCLDETGEVLEPDLLRLGWAPHQLAAFGPAAREALTRLLVGRFRTHHGLDGLGDPTGARA